MAVDGCNIVKMHILVCLQDFYIEKELNDVSIQHQKVQIYCKDIGSSFIHF